METLRDARVCNSVRLLVVEEQEEKQQEHPLMPTIIARFSELGAVIESQKRHIDLWKVGMDWLFRLSGRY
jgi:hypothetical protein